MRGIRGEIRAWMNEHMEAIPHNEERKMNEIRLFTDILEIPTKKWVIPILMELELTKGLHFNGLQRNISGISSRILSDRLKELEAEGFIERIPLDTRPPRVRYELCDRGHGLVEMALLMVLHLLDNQNLDKSDPS